MTDNTKKDVPPKRPQCAFFIYKQEVYQEVKEANPGKKMTDITKIISEQYKKLTKDNIDKYEQKYKENKAAFEIEKKIYEDKYGKIKNERKKSKKGAADKDGAKKAKVIKKKAAKSSDESGEDDEE